MLSSNKSERAWRSLVLKLPTWYELAREEDVPRKVRTRGVALAGVLLAGGLLAFSSAPGALGPALAASLVLGPAARWRSRAAHLPAGVVPAVAGLAAVLAGLLADGGNLDRQAALARLAFHGTLGYMVMLAVEMSARRSPGQALYNLVCVGGLWAGLSRVMLGVLTLPAGALPPLGGACLQGVLVGFVVSALAVAPAEGKTDGS
jgi:hypothetical protein